MAKIPEGSRKLVVGCFAIVGFVLMTLLGDLDTATAAQDTLGIAIAYMAGNGLEHIGDGLKKR